MKFYSIRPYLWTIAIVLCARMASAQCDTAVVNREIREIDRIIWTEYRRVLTLSQEFVQKYKGKGNWCEGRATYILGKVMWTNGEYDESIRTLLEAVRLSRLAGDLETSARSYLAIANDYYYQAYYDSAKANFLRSLITFVTLNHRTGQIEVLHDMALMYHRSGSYAASLKALLESEQLKELEPGFVHYVGDFSVGNPYFIDTLYYRGVIANEQGLLAKFKEGGNGYGIYQSLINISTAYKELADHRRAGYYAAAGSQVMKSLGYFPFWYMAANEYGLAGMKDSCFYFLARAVEEFPRATQIKVATTFQQLGSSFLQFQQPDSAVKYFDKALVLNEKMNNRITIPDLHLGLARAYRMMGDMDKAEHHLNVGLKRAHGVSGHHLSSLYSFGLELYENMNQPEKALLFARQHNQLEDSINRNENAMMMIRFQAQYETSKKEKELEAARLVLRNRNIILFSLAIIALLAITFMVAFYIQRQKIKRQNVRLSESNVEQRALMQEVHHRVKNNLQYIVSLLSLQAQTVQNPELSQQIEEIKSRIVTIGIIHQRLYQSQEIPAVELPVFIQELVVNMLKAMRTRVIVMNNLTIDPIRVDIETGISIGLLVNELLTNSVKHAFLNHPAPEFNLTIREEGDEIVMQISDNGPGFELKKSGKHGFGIRLIELLVRKLKGALLQIDPNTLEIRITAFTIVKPTRH